MTHIITTTNVLYHNLHYHALNFEDAGKSFFHADFFKIYGSLIALPCRATR